MNHQTLYLTLTLSLLILKVFHSSAQTNEPRFAEVKSIFKTLQVKEQKGMHKSTLYFELYYKGDNDAFKENDTILLFSKRNSVVSNGSIGVFRFINNNTLEIYSYDGNIGTTTGIKIYERNRFLRRPKIYPKYNLSKRKTKTYLRIDTDKDEKYVFAIIEMIRSGADNFTFVLKRLK